MNPSSVDLRPNMDTVEDQGVNNACTGYAGAKAMDVFYERAGQPLVFSPAYLWAKERILTSVQGNNGVTVGAIPAALQAFGVCLNSTLPDTTPFDYVPTDADDAEAANFKCLSHEGYGVDIDGMKTVERIKTSIAKGIPVLLTIYVFVSMETRCTGPWKFHQWDVFERVDNMPIGSHEVVIIGFDDDSARFLLQNSWGMFWADGGFFGAPYVYIGDNSISIMQVGLEMRPAGVRPVNAGWRPDMTPAQTQVQQAYVAYFGRPADPAGLDYWAGVVEAAGAATILDGFAASDESKALYPYSTTPAVIAAAYQNLFNRAPDAPGLEFWATQVARGAITLGGAIYAVLQGAQGTDADAVAAKVEAAGVLTYEPGYDTAHIPAARAWLAGITTKAQVQPAVQDFNFLGAPA